MVSLGAKAREAQLATWKCWEAVATAPSSPKTSALTASGFAVGRVEGEVRAVEVDEDRAQAEGDALEDLGQGVGDGGDLGGFGVDVEAVADDDVAEVIATGDGGGDEDEGEGGALVGAGEVDLAGEVEGVGAGAGAGGRFADLARGAGSWGRPAPRGRCGFRAAAAAIAASGQ